MIWNPFARNEQTEPSPRIRKNTESVPFIIAPNIDFITAHIRAKIQKLSALRSPSDADSTLLAGLQKSKPALLADGIVNVRKNRQAAVLTYHAKLGKSVVEHCIGTDEFMNRVTSAFANQHAQVFARANTHPDFLYMQKTIEDTTQKVSVEAISNDAFLAGLKDIAALLNAYNVDRNKLFIKG